VVFVVPASMEDEYIGRRWKPSRSGRRAEAEPVRVAESAETLTKPARVLI
jgi:hypothetical protein